MACAVICFSVSSKISKARSFIVNPSPELGSKFFLNLYRANKFSALNVAIRIDISSSSCYGREGLPDNSDIAESPFRFAIGIIHPIRSFGVRCDGGKSNPVPFELLIPMAAAVPFSASCSRRVLEALFFLVSNFTKSVPT